MLRSSPVADLSLEVPDTREVWRELRRAADHPWRGVVLSIHLASREQFCRRPSETEIPVCPSLSEPHPVPCKAAERNRCYLSLSSTWRRCDCRQSVYNVPRNQRTSGTQSRDAHRPLVARACHTKMRSACLQRVVEEKKYVPEALFGHIWCRLHQSRARTCSQFQAGIAGSLLADEALSSFRQTYTRHGRKPRTPWLGRESLS